MTSTRTPSASLNAAHAQGWILADFLEGKAPRTHVLYRRVLACFADHVRARHLDGDDITTAVRTLLSLPRPDADALMHAFEAALVSRHLEDRTIDHHIAVLRAIVNEAHGPAATVHWPERRCTAQFNNTEPLPLAELDPVLELAEAAQGWPDLSGAVLVYLAHFAVLRPLEIQSLDVADILPAACIVRVQSAPPGSRPAQRHTDIVRFDTRAAAVLVRYGALRGTTPGPFITARDRAHQVSVRTLQRRLEAFGKRAGIAGLTFDALRDLGIHRALRERDVRYAQQLTRHANPHYLAKYYMNLRLPRRASRRRGAPLPWVSTRD